MKRTIVIILFILLSITCNTFAQKKKSIGVSDLERKTSVVFAEGLKSFYSNDYNAAEQTFRSILEKEKKHDATYFMLAKIKTEQKNYSDAIYYLQEAIKINKDNEWYPVELAKLYDLTGNYEESSKLWAKLAELKPNIEDYLISEADALVHLKKYTEVIKVYDKLEILLGYNEEITETKKNIWLYLGNVKNAVGEYEKRIAEFPNDIRNYVRAGDIYLANKQFDKSLPYYQKALEIDSANLELQFALAEYYEAINNSEQSWHYLLQVIKSPDYPLEEKLPTVKNIFTTYVLSGEKSGVKKSDMFDMISSITTAHPEAVEGWANLATLHILDKEYAQARTALEKALSVNESSFTLWEDYFFVLTQLNDANSIIKEADRVMILFPGNAMLLYSIGSAYLTVGNANKSATILKSAASNSYDSILTAQIYDKTGDAYLALDNTEEAVKYWKMAKKKGLNTQTLNEKLQKYE